MITPEQIKLNQTCSACPEQYECYLESDENKSTIGYLRLRHSWFYVAYPDCGGKIIYEAKPRGDGIFEESEREFYLNRAKLAICNVLNNVENTDKEEESYENENNI